MLETYTISKIDVLEGKSEINLEGLSKLILELENEKSFDLAGDTSKCPDSPIINQIISEMADSFYKTTGLTIELCKKLLTGRYAKIFANLSKKDDSADAYLQFYFFIKEM